ncbi:MAG: hypothetical protein HOJ62_05680 [Planctomycetaceae bacterium]|nr:hypothetical protein [Planctomycetaceae bacterium]
MRLALIFSTLLLPFAAGCAGFGNTTANNETTTGALIGGVTGALIGEHNDDPLAGAIIGTTAGALLGNAIGQENEQAEAELAAAAEVYRQNAVTLNQILEMTQAGVDDAVIISCIEANGPAQQLSTADIISLSNSQVAPSVISAYQTTPHGPELQDVHQSNLDPHGRHYPFPVSPPTTGFSIGFDFGN